MCASWPTTLASLTRPGLQRAQMLGILGDAKVITVPIALTHVCLPNLWSQGRLTHCNSALFAQSVKSDLGVPWRRASWRVSGSEIWSKDWYEVGLFVWPFYFVLAQFPQRPRPIIPRKLTPV